jgi:catechol 2,3-dioxygenase-like lactoylglutathione lyase family enzyme
MTIEINGMAHVILTVSRFDLARAFYGKLLPEFGMKPVYDGDRLFYCVGARTAIGIEPCDPDTHPAAWRLWYRSPKGNAPATILSIDLSVVNCQQVDS